MKCAELCSTRTQIVLPTIRTQAGIGTICVVGEAPGADEDRVGEGFVGASGRKLHALFESNGVTAFCKTNAVRCRPPGNRNPRSEEVQNCISYLDAFLLDLKPAVIVTVGWTPTRLFFRSKKRLYDVITSKSLAPDPHDVHTGLFGWLTGAACPVVGMPHTSPLAWNRNAPSGEKWSVIGQEQIRLACEIAKKRAATATRHTHTQGDA